MERDFIQWNPLEFFLTRLSQLPSFSPRCKKAYPAPVCACRDPKRLVLHILEIKRSAEEKENKWLKALQRQSVSLCRRKEKSISEEYLTGKTGFGIPYANEIWILGTERKRGKIQTICGFALIQHRTSGSHDYLYLDVLCSRALTSLGGILLETILERLNRDSHYDYIELRALPALISYYQKFGFKEGSPRLLAGETLFQGEEYEDGIHMYISKLRPAMQKPSFLV